MKDPALTAAQAQAPEIIGGEEAAPGAWPWMVALWDNNTEEWYGCGGSLISREWVLTAAHCITDDGRTSVTPASLLSVVVGRHDLTTTAGQRIQVSEVIYHPSYNLASFSDADIALLRLAEPVTLAESVQPVKLATQGDGAHFAAGIVATVTGWGTRTSGAQDFPDALHQVEVPIVDFATCQARYEDAILGRVTGNMLCAGVPEGGKDSCQGDSGGPLVVPDGANGWLQAGIVSWGNLCALPTWPGVYTRIANFTGWVDDAQDTLTAGPYSASDGTGLPGHSAEGAVFGSTLVRPITLYMPIIEE
jgi:secreted trypsin-like serine protease